MSYALTRRVGKPALEKYCNINQMLPCLGQVKASEDSGRVVGVNEG
jgi:hypothetical protein